MDDEKTKAKQKPIEAIKAWLIAAGWRAFKTFFQTLVSLIIMQSAGAQIVGYPVLGDISWGWVLSGAALAAIVSLITSTNGIPEVNDGTSLPKLVKGGKDE